MNEKQLYRVIEKWRFTPYDWSSGNCCQFAADIARCSGVDFQVPDFETPADAAVWIRAQGAKSLYHYLVKLFGQPRAPLQGKRGWIAYRKGEGLDGSAVGAIERKALFVSSKGLIEVPLGQCAAVFDPGRWRGMVRQ